MIEYYYKLQGKIEYYYKNALLRFWFIYTYWSVDKILIPFKAIFIVFVAPFFSLVFLVMWCLQMIGRLISFIPVLRYIFLVVVFIFDKLSRLLGLLANLPVLKYYLVYTKYRNHDKALLIASIHNVEDRIKKNTKVGEVKNYNFDKDAFTNQFSYIYKLNNPGVDDNLNRAYSMIFNQCVHYGDSTCKSIKKSYYLSFELLCLSMFYWKFRSENLNLDKERSAQLIENIKSLTAFKICGMYKSWNNRYEEIEDLVRNRIEIYYEIRKKCEYNTLTDMMNLALEQCERFVSKNVIYEDISPRDINDMDFNLDYEDTIKVRDTIKKYYEGILKSRGISDDIERIFG